MSTFQQNVLVINIPAMCSVRWQEHQFWIGEEAYPVLYQRYVGNAAMLLSAAAPLDICLLIFFGQHQFYNGSD